MPRDLAVLRLNSAQAALDRISIPQDVLDRIAPTALPRSSLIISDEPLNRETNYRTEFVVALHNQPQGGLSGCTGPRAETPGTTLDLRAGAAASTTIGGRAASTINGDRAGGGEDAARRD